MTSTFIIASSQSRRNLGNSRTRCRGWFSCGHFSPCNAKRRSLPTPVGVRRSVCPANVLFLTIPEGGKAIFLVSPQHPSVVSLYTGGSRLPCPASSVSKRCGESSPTFVLLQRFDMPSRYGSFPLKPPYRAACSRSVERQPIASRAWRGGLPRRGLTPSPIHPSSFR
jgi:hypothetical protein